MPKILKKKEHSSPQAHPDDAEEKQKLNARLKALMEQDRIMLFMKGTQDAPRCGFSKKVVNLLKDQGVEFSSFDILSDESVRQGIAHPRSTRTSVPDALR